MFLPKYKLGDVIFFIFSVLTTLDSLRQSFVSQLPFVNMRNGRDECCMTLRYIFFFFTMAFLQILKERPLLESFMENAAKRVKGE